MKDSLKNLAYDYIRTRIMNCEYMPLSFIDAARVSRELGISRTPVRDSITRLENEGLVSVKPRRGIMVTEIPADEVDNIAGARRLLEPYIVSVACGKADRDVMQDFRDRFSSASNEKEQIDNEYAFNLYLTHLTDNEYIIQTMEHVYISNFRVQTIGKMPTCSTEILLELIDCIMDGDPEKASSTAIRLISAQGIY